MGKVNGFLEYQRKVAEKRDPQERLKDWQEMIIPRSAETTCQQAARCMDCGIPFCQQGCPLGNLIPDWNDAVYRGDWQRVYQALSATNPLPEFTGRLCPAPCEASCVLAINDQAVTIEQIELEVIEKAFDQGWVHGKAPTLHKDEKIAVIGSGPAGLATAIQLNYAGYHVDVYEKDEELGGLLRHGIPDFKLEKWVIDRRIKIMKQAGIRFFTQCTIGGTDYPWSKMLTDYDAIALCIGAQKPRDLTISGRDLHGVHFAMDYLTLQNHKVAHSDVYVAKADIQAKDKHVVILGGGDTGADCLGTALRQGAKHVTQLELMPAPPHTRSSDNLWPQWPLIYRVSSSHEEGGERQFAFMTEEFIGDDDGHVCALKGYEISCVKTAQGYQFIRQGEARIIQADLILLALGFTQPLINMEAPLSVPLDLQNRLQVDENFRCGSLPIFAAGDAQRGASLIVWVIADGVEMARSIDLYLAQQSHLKTKGLDFSYRIEN